MAIGYRHRTDAFGKVDLSELAEAGAAREEKNAGRRRWQMDVKKDSFRISNSIKWSTPGMRRDGENKK